LMDGGTLEDDEEMAERWASLLANVAGGARDVPPSFASVLRDLEPEQARILDHVYQTMMQIAPELRRGNLGMSGWRPCAAGVRHPERNDKYSGNAQDLGWIPTAAAWPRAVQPRAVDARQAAATPRPPRRGARGRLDEASPGTRRRARARCCTNVYCGAVRPRQPPERARTTTG
jgi:hypothetical protein